MNTLALILSGEGEPILITLCKICVAFSWEESSGLKENQRESLSGLKHV